MKSGHYLIYGLVDPNSGQLRYIGKSSSGIYRAMRHSAKSELAKDRSYKGNWLRSLSLKPKIVIIQDFKNDKNIIDCAEMFWINYFKNLGCPLTNLTNGGDGCVGRKMSDKTKNKISSAQKGKPRFSEEMKLHFSAIRKGRPPVNKGKCKYNKFVDQFGNIFTMKDFCLKYNTTQASVNRVLAGTRKSIYNLRLTLLEE